MFDILADQALLDHQVLLEQLEDNGQALADRLDHQEQLDLLGP